MAAKTKKLFEKGGTSQPALAVSEGTKEGSFHYLYLHMSGKNT